MVSATAYQMDEAEKERERQNQIGKSVEQTREFSSFCTTAFTAAGDSSLLLLPAAAAYPLLLLLLYSLLPLMLFRGVL